MAKTALMMTLGKMRKEKMKRSRTQMGVTLMWKLISSGARNTLMATLTLILSKRAAAKTMAKKETIRTLMAQKTEAQS